MTKIVDEYQSNFDNYISGNIYEGQKYKIEYILKHFVGKNKNVSIIDIGCGYGSFLCHAENNGYKNAKGIDQSRKQIEIARKNGLNNVENISLSSWLKNEKSKFDVIILLDILEHVDTTDVLELIAELKQRLHKGGKMIIHVPNGSSPLFGHIRYGDITHKNAFTEKSFEQIANHLGMTLKVYSDPPMLNNIKGLIRRLIFHIFSILIRLYQYAETGRCYKTSANIYAVLKYDNEAIS